MTVNNQTQNPTTGKHSQEQLMSQDLGPRGWVLRQKGEIYTYKKMRAQALDVSNK